LVARAIRSRPPRDARLDALRGFFLILMTGVHVPMPWSDRFHDPLGCVGAADGFVFMSACLAGLVYGHISGPEGWTGQRRRIWQRVRLIYGVHLLGLLPVALLAWWGAGRMASLTGHFSDFLVHPAASLALMPLLLHQPPLFDILPMYVIFLSATPWLLSFARRHGWRGLLAGSGLIWLLVQCHLDVPLFADSTRWLPVRWGSFDPFAWQLLWVVGVALGESGRRHSLSVQWRRAGILVPALAVVGFGLVKRHGGWPHRWWNDDLYLWMDKWTLGPLRLLDFFAWVLVLVAWNPRLTSRWLAPLSLLGRHSLAVFALHLPLVIGFAVWVELRSPSEVMQNGMGLVVMGVLFAWAGWLDGRRGPVPLRGT